MLAAEFSEKTAQIFRHFCFEVDRPGKITSHRVDAGDRNKVTQEIDNAVRHVSSPPQTKSFSYEDDLKLTVEASCSEFVTFSLEFSSDWGLAGSQAGD